MNRVFLDTNILLDYILDRGAATVRAEEIIESCIRGEIECCIAPHSLTNIFYILRRSHSVAERKFIIKNLLTICEVQAVDKSLLLQALDDEKYDDFEDALQMTCARQWNAEMFVTRDKDLALKADSVL